MLARRVSRFSGWSSWNRKVSARFRNFPSPCEFCWKICCAAKTAIRCMRKIFLRWRQTAFRNFKVVPPDTGICHQVNIEYLARVVCSVPNGNRLEAYPDSLVGTDSHTTMVNSLGVFGWGVGGIEAEAAMLGQPLSMLVPEVVGFKLHGRLKEGTTATDLVLTVTEMR